MGKALKVAVGIGLFFVGGGSGALIARAIGTNILLGEAAKALGPKPPKNRQKPQTITARSANMPGQIVYGETRTSGMLYIPTPGVSGSGNKYLHYIVVLAAHEVESITDIWLDTDKVNDADIGVDGIVTTGRFEGKLLIEKFLGADDQAASTILSDAIADWDSAFAGKGIAYIHLRMERDDEAFPNGPPQNVFAMVKGRKVLDPRSGTTAWSSNPALCIRDYLVNFVDAPIDDTLLSAAANICDESVTVPSGTQSRYACSGILSTGEDPRGNIESLLSSMNGASTFIGGKFQVYAGAYDAPIHSIDKSWLAGPFDAQLHMPGDKNYNIVRGSYIDPDRNWQEVEHEIMSISSYAAVDGRAREREMSYPFTQSEYQAQRQSYQTLLKSRGQRTLQLALNLKGLNIKAWETANVDLSDYGISGIYRVTEWKYGDNSPVQVTLTEESSGYYAEPTYITPQTVTVSGTVSEFPSAPNNLSITTTASGNSISWTSPPSRQYDQIIIYSSATDDFSTATELARTRGTSYFHATTQARFYWLQATNGSQLSPVVPTTDGISGGTDPSGGDLAASLSASSKSLMIGNGNSGTFASVDCYASGGVSPYAYSWTRVSGSTAITADTDTDSSTTFSVTAGTDETKQAVFKCTVTDSDDPAVVVDSGNLTLTATFTTLSSPVPGGGGEIQEP